MENIPAKKTGAGKYLLILAGVFLVALAAVPLAKSIWSSTRGSNPASQAGAGTEPAWAGSGVAAAADNVPAADANTAGGEDPSIGVHPVRLRIPSLGVDAPVWQVGLTSSGNMDTPKSSTAVAWYKLGPKPGDPGSAVIAGHVNTRYDSEGVFYNLDKIQIGAELAVTDSAGKTLRFRVVDKKFLDFNASPEQVFGSTSARRLNLITCTGKWLPDQKTYSERLVVFTELVD